VKGANNVITGKHVAEKAKSLLQMGTIPYVLGGEDPAKGLDCQGLVEWVLRELGMKASYKGTNDMWRNMLAGKGTIEEGVTRLGEIPLGALLFICDYGTVPSGYSDAPDCEHVYIKIEDGLLIHASASNQKVCTRTFADKTIPNGGPTHYGLITGVSYDCEEASEEAETSETETNVTPAAKKWKPLYSGLCFELRCVGDGPREIQMGLNKLGYSLDVDGEFGQLTEETVIKFQIAQGLEADGVVGKDTWAALIKAVNALKTKEG